MKKDLTKIPGTIAYVLTNHASELRPLFDDRSRFGELRAKVNEILDSNELDKNRNAANEAKRILDNCTSYNHYLETYWTYQSGDKLGI